MAELILGRLKFHWKGNWAAATAFIKDDVVKYGPSAYVCTANHTSTSDFDFTKFELMSEGVSWAGEWNDTTKYQANDIVNYGGAIYICILDHGPGDSTDTSPNSQDFWSRLVGGFEWEGNYDNSTEYQRGDVVRYGGYTYINLQTSTGNLPTNTLYWDILNRGYRHVGTYQASTTYLPGELANFGGRIYACYNTSLGNEPIDTDYWFLFADGTKWRGDFDDNSVQYAIGDIVKYGPRTYINILGYTSTGILLPDNPTYWTLHTDGQSWQGNYSHVTTYKPGEIVKYGARNYICTATTFQRYPTDASFWDLFNDGQQWADNWSTGVEYKIGDIVRYGARSYICIDGHTSASNILPTDPSLWGLVNKGLDWKGAWVNGTDYKLDDVVEYSGSSYVCIQAHNTSLAGNPSTESAYWASLAQGDISSPMTTTGDMIYRSAGGSIVRLPIGGSGSYLTVNNGVPYWGIAAPEKNYYVALTGDDANDGRTLATAWRTMRHACDETFSNGQTKIIVMAGTYEEQAPIRVGREVVLEGDGLGSVTISPNTSRDEGFGVGISDDGSTPNANSYVFHMNNGARMRNMVFRGFSTGSVLVSLDPGYGPDDTSVWITSQSPYVQNCTSFTPGGTGFKIDGSLHNGGYKSMVANDWTQINSDGIGIHALNDGRTEIVSCFTYYCQVGYLAETGAKIRAIVGNNSYGEYGAIARGFSQSETPLTGKLRLTDQTINSVQTLGTDVHVFTSYRDSVGNRFFVGHTAPTGTDVSSTFDNAASYPFVAKFNAAGSLDWAYTYESSYGAIHSAVELSDRIYCGGVIYDGANKGFILSISKAGEIQWQKTIGDTTEISDLATDGNNLYAVGTHSTSGGTVIKLNPAGIEQWSRTLEYNDSSAAGNLVPTSCTFAGTPTTSVDTYALAGDATAADNLYIASYDSGTNQSLITRISSTGTYVATYQYGDVRINKLRLDTGNGDGIYLMAAGYYDPAGAVSKNPLAFRLTVNGTVAWQKQIAEGSENGEWKDVLPFGDDVYLVGYINESTNNNNTGVVARYTSSGTNDWIYKFDNGTNNIALNGVMLDGVNVISAGIEQGNSVILNVQRDAVFGIGTVTSGSYIFSQRSITETANTVLTQQFNEIYQASIALGTTDQSLTLNQTPGKTRTIVATRDGFAGIGTGVLFSVDELDRSPKEGSVLTIDGDSETYFVIGVNNFLEGDSTNAGTCQIQIDPAIPSNKTPNDQTNLTFREAFSQVRMSGHDFLDIGTGGFADTNYPVIIASDYVQQPDQNRETLAEAGGRVFYVTTDQDGNFRVGDYFKVEQATGRATLSSEEFDLAGLNELQLGSITAGKQGATINEFSTDGTFADNSDTAVPTERAVKTYVDNKIGAASQIKAGTSPSETTLKITGNGSATDTINFEIAGTLIAQIASQYQLIPKGNGTTDRPGSPVSGYLRYNTDINALEVYNGSAWVPAGGLSNVSVDHTTSPYAASTFQFLYVDTSVNAVTVNLPASANQGDQIRFIDVAGTFATNNLTIGRNGLKIFGLTDDVTVNTTDASFSLVYTGATYGWKLMEL